MAGENTGGSSGGIAATGTGTGTRALDAAMASTSVFVPQGGAMAMRASERHIDRMAPERDAARRSRPLAALGFSDRVLGPYVRHAQQSPVRMFGGVDAPAEVDVSQEREIEATSWIFPRPWYLDELAWLQSTRLSASAAEGGAARSARAASLRGRGPAGVGLGAVALTTSAAPAMALDLVAPSFGRAGGVAEARQRAALASAVAAGGAPAARPIAAQPALAARPAALRAWSPLVPFQAVQAAELMAGVLAPAASAAGDDVPWQGSEARMAPAQELVAPFVAPRELIASRPAESATQAATRAATRSTRPDSSKASDVPEALRNRLQNALRRLEAQRAQTRAAGAAPGQTAVAPAAARPGASGASTRPAAVTAPASARTGATTAATTGATAPASASAPASGTTGSAAPAATTGSAAPAATTGSAAPAATTGSAAPAATTASPAAAGAVAAAAPVPARERALELMLHSALAGRTGQDMAAVTGPRLALPAGLGGLVAGLRAARTVSRPVASPARATAATGMRVPAATAGAIAAPAAMPGAAAAGAQALAATAGLPLVGSAPGATAAPDATVFGQPAGTTARVPGTSYSSAYRAVMQSRPAALAHIAWSDRWLARFAGASTQALAALEATTSPAANTPASRAFSGQAPEPVFLSVSLAEREAARAATAGAAASAAAAGRANLATPPGGRTAAVPAPVAQPSAAASTAVSTGPARHQAAPAAPRAGAAATAPALAAAPRIADDESVSDDVFAAIAAAASRAPRRPAQPARGGDAGAASTGASRAAAAAATPVATAATSAPAGALVARTGEARSATAEQDIGQMSGGVANHVDRLLAASPAAPGPGMRVALASSPVAPALSALLPLPPSPSFDVRAMHGLELASAYLAGVIEPGGLANTAARPWPMLSPFRWEQGAAVATQDRPSVIEPGLWTEMPMVAPSAASAAPGASADAGRPAAAQRLAPGAAPAASAPITRASSATTGASVEARRAMPAQDRARPIAGPGPLLPAIQPASAGPAPSAAVQAAANRAAPGAASGEAARAGAVVTAPGAQIAQTTAAATTFAYGPGGAAAQAESWATMREQSAADLALDYVSPELLVAAQAYGFGPAEAAQAARLSSSGRTGLAALAAAVDLRFIDAFAAARSGEWPAARSSSSPSASSSSASVSSPSGARPVSSAGTSSAPARAPASTSGGALGAASQGGSGSVPAGAVVSAPAGSSAAGAASAPASVQASALLAASATASSAPGSVAMPMTAAAGGAPTPAAGARALGMPVRTPRGAFLWPHATIMAMNLQLAEADTSQPLSLAALDLLAANAVAQMGALVAPEQAPAVATQQAGARPVGAAAGAGTDARPAAGAGMSPAAMGAGQALSAPALRTGLSSATPLAPDVLAAVVQRDSLLAAGAPPATYVTPVIDLDFGPGSGRGPALDPGRAVSITSPAAATGASAPVSRAAWSGANAAPGAAVAEGMTDTPVAAAAAIGHRSSLPAGFEALYVALSRSPAGRSLSPAVRAARALALAGSYVAPATATRAGETTAGAGTRARAAAAWAVMPTVLTGGADAFWAGTPGAAALPGASAPDMPTLTGAALPGSDLPERQMMAARAGESLQSFVAPGEAPRPISAERAPSASASSVPAPRSRGAVQRVPSAAQPLVQTAPNRANVAAAQDMIRAAQQKRSSGDNSIPAWFEEAARRMFQEGSEGGGISLAEMTLVTAAPARLVAASPKSASAGSAGASRAPAAGNGSESHDAEPTANVEQIARDVYAEICRMIDVARNRNGDSWR